MPFGFITRRSSVISMSIGVLLGFISAYILYRITEEYIRPTDAPLTGSRIMKNYVDRHSHSIDVDENSNLIANFLNENNYAKLENRDDLMDVALELKRKIRVLCWVMTMPANHKKKAIHVKATWGKRCNILLFMSSTLDNELPTVALPVREGRNNLWAKTKEAFKYIYNHYNGQYDWVIKTDDDTFVIVENLRYMLNNFEPTKPLYLGCRFKPFVEQGYMSGGAGYVLSKEAVRKFVNEGLSNENCRQDNGGAEDVEIGRCLELVGVEAGDTRDHLGRGRFFPFVPAHFLIPGHTDRDFWYWKYIYYPQEEGPDCCSDTAVSFHYVSPIDMYVFYYFLYQLRPYGISRKSDHKTSPVVISDLRIRTNTTEVIDEK